MTVGVAGGHENCTLSELGSWGFELFGGSWYLPSGLISRTQKPATPGAQHSQNSTPDKAPSSIKFQTRAQASRFRVCIRVWGLGHCISSGLESDF